MFSDESTFDIDIVACETNTHAKSKSGIPVMGQLINTRILYSCIKLHINSGCQ